MLDCLLQKKKKPEKKVTVATYDIPTPKGEKKGEQNFKSRRL